MEILQGRAPVDDDDAGIAADVAEGLVVGAGDYVAAIAAHQAELGGAAGGGGEGVVEVGGA